MIASRRIGSATVFALTDGETTLPLLRTEAFPAATAEQWARAEAFDPRATALEGQWLLQFRAFVIRLDGGQVILVDAGIGAADSAAASWAPTPGRLPEELAAAGFAPDDVSRVVLTHLHPDHIGWSSAGLFPKAEVLIQQAESDWIPAELRDLLPNDQLVYLDGDTHLGDGITVVATPGHTPGHQSVLVDDGTHLLAITGDLLVHALQVVAPEVGYQHEMDQDKARQSRTSLMAEVARRGGELATPHLTEPFVKIS